MSFAIVMDETKLSIRRLCWGGNRSSRCALKSSGNGDMHKLRWRSKPMYYTREFLAITLNVHYFPKQYQRVSLW